MRRIAVTAILLLISVCAPAAVRTAFPMERGTEWTYEGTVRWTYADSNRVGSRNIRWTMKVIRKVRRRGFEAALLKGGPWDLASYDPDRKPGWYLVVRRAGEYYLYSDEDDARAVFQKIVVNGKLPDDLAEHLWFRAPLRPGAKFCPPDVESGGEGAYCWVVEGPHATTLPDVAGESTAMRLVFRTARDSEIADFVPGVGITSWDYVHRGSVAEAHLRLVKLTRPPVSRR